jgi:predicted dehydrogenase
MTALKESIMGNPVGVAILGCGYWGVNYVRVVSELANARVAAICDMRPERLQEVGARFPWAAQTTSIEEAVLRDDVQAVIVCTQATSHFEVTNLCLNAGKHALVEKPLTTNVADAEQLVALADAKGLRLMVGHTFLFNSGIRKVKQYITSGKVGRVYYLYARRTNLGPVRRDVNAVWDLATHDVSIFNFLLDRKPLWVSAVGSRVLHNGREDVGFISIGYDDDIVGHIHVSWADPSKVREVVVVGSDMRILFDDVNTVEQVRVFQKGIATDESEASTYGEHQLLVRDGDIISPRLEVSEPLKNQVNNFLESISNGSPPFTTSVDGLTVVKVMAAIDQSMAKKGVPVALEGGELNGYHNPKLASAVR